MYVIYAYIDPSGTTPTDRQSYTSPMERLGNSLRTYRTLLLTVLVPLAALGSWISWAIPTDHHRGSSRHTPQAGSTSRVPLSKCFILPLW